MQFPLDHPPDELTKLRAAADKAIEMDPLLTEAYEALAMADARDAHWRAAEHEFRHAIEAIRTIRARAPSSRCGSSRCWAAAARRSSRRAAPRSTTRSRPTSRIASALSLMEAGRYEEAESHCAKLPSDVSLRPQCLGRAWLGQGRIADGIATLRAACATAVLFGFLPMLSAIGPDPLGVLKSGAAAGRGASRIPFGRTLVVTQIAVSLVLLVAAGLFVRSLTRLKDVDLGFDPNQVVLFRVSPPSDQQPIPAETRRQLYRQLLERAVSVPGVDGASAAFSGLLSSETWRNVITVEGFTPADGHTLRTYVNAVTPTYFDVMRIAVLRGRGFTEDDREKATSVAIVNDAFVRQFSAGVAPIGRRVGLCNSESCGPAATRMMEIVGVAEDAKYSNLRVAAPPILYVPYTQVERSLGELQVRTTGDVSAVASTVFRALADVDRRLAIVGMTTARDRVDASLATENMVAKLSSIFGLVALALAAVGLSGLVAYMTAQRTQEIGIRMALGAGTREVRRLVLGNTIRLVALGAGIGIPAALALARLLSDLLYQVEPYDPVVLSLSLGVLVCVALVAGYLPAQRAARVDPIKALRSE